MSAHLKLLIKMMYADSEPLAPSVSCQCLCSYVYCGIARAALYKLFMSYIGYGSKHFYISRYRLARGLHTHDTTTTKSQQYNWNIDRLTASVLHASPCLQLSITDGLAILCQGEGSRPRSPLALVNSTCFKPRLPTYR